MNEEQELAIKNIEDDTMLVCLRNGVRIYIDSNQTERIWENIKEQKGSQFIKIGKDIINTADMVGIFCHDTAQDLKKEVKKFNW